MRGQTQISAVVSNTTKSLFENYARATGVKKGHLIEEALWHHLEALQALPADVILHPRIVISRHSGDALLGRLSTTTPPTKKLRDLMADDAD